MAAASERVQVLRQQYSRPVKAGFDSRKSDPMDYCVGGAFCISLGSDDRFPEDNKLAEILTKENPNLSRPGDDPRDSFCMSEAYQNWQYENDEIEGYPVPPPVPTLAYDFASTIIHHNDNEEFDQAWSWLEKALQYDGINFTERPT